MEVNLTKRIQTADGLRYCPVVIAANGRVKPDWVVVNGVEEKLTGGAYYIEWREAGKRKRLSVGKDAANAQARRLRKQAELKAIAQGIALVPEETNGNKQRLSAAIATFLEETQLTKKLKTYQAYTLSLGYFAESCTKPFVEDIERADLLRFAAFLRDTKKLSPRTCWNKFSNVLSFLKAAGRSKIVKKGDWPKFVEEQVEVYSKRDLKELLAVCDERERLMFEFFLYTGMREQEVMYCTWTDVNFDEATVRVKWKPIWGWTPKQYKEREVPVPDVLLASLRKRQPKGAVASMLIFPSENNKPNSHMLRVLKRVAKRAGLNPENFWLHRFRATFATTALQAGVDLATVQAWLGHTDMESTLRYLKAATGSEVRAKVNRLWA